MIRLLNVRKGFNMGRHNEYIAVSDVNLVIGDRLITVLRGPSGSGKTTLLGLIGCMTRPTAGRVTIDTARGLDCGFPGGADAGEIEVTSLPERFLSGIRRRTFGFIFQQFNLIPGITVLENVMLPAYPLGGKRRSVTKRALSLLELLRLERHAASPVEWLSGGEAERVAIARALMNDPPFIIADEPTAHLDSALSREFMDIMTGLKARGKTVIIASHDPLVFEGTGVDRVITVRDGRVDGDGQ